MADFPILKMGSIDKKVMGVQAMLNKWYTEHKLDVSTNEVNKYPPLVTDGLFGTKTEARVKDFQERNGLKVDGIFGPISFDALNPAPVWKPAARHKVLNLTQGEKVNRALGMCGAEIEYHLKYPNGGTDPTAPLPCDLETKQLDCAGFKGWVEGYDRDFLDGMSKTFDNWDGYCNTDSCIEEATREGMLFSVICARGNRNQHPRLRPFPALELGDIQPGDAIVSASFRKPEVSSNTVGHCGIVTFVGNVKRDGLHGIHVVHCSPSNVPKNAMKSSIWKTDGEIWHNYPEVYIIRFNNEYAYKRWQAMTGAPTE